MISTRNRAGVLCGAVTAVAAFALGGCSSSGGGDTAAAASTSARAVQTTVAAPKKLDPLAFVYAQGAETASYTETSAPSADSDLADPEVSPFRMVAACLGTTVEAPIAAADGAALSLDEEGITLSSSAQIVSSAQRAKDDQALRDPRFAPCLEQAFVREVTGDGAPNESVHWGQAALANARVPSGALARVVVNLPVLDNGTDQPLETMVVDIVFLSSGQVEGELVVTSLSTPVNDVVSAATTQLVAKFKQQ